MSSEPRRDIAASYREWIEENHNVFDEAAPASSSTSNKGLNLFSTEVDALWQCVSERISAFNAAKQLLTFTYTQRKHTANPKDKERRISELLYLSVLYFDDLHEPLVCLYNAVDDLEQNHAVFQEFNVAGELENNISECWRIGERCSQSENDATLADEYVVFSHWYALRAGLEHDASVLPDAFSAIIYGLENDLPYPADESLAQCTGPNRGIRVAANWLLHCAVLIYEVIKDGTADCLGPQWFSTQAWPAEKGTRITRERWQLWRTRLVELSRSAEPRLNEDVKTSCRNANMAMDRAAS